MLKVKIIITNGHRNLKTCSFRAINEARYLQQKGYDVELIVLQNKEIGAGVISNEIEGISAKHYICRSEKLNRALDANKFIKKFKLFIYFVWYMKFTLWMKKYIKSTGADYLQCHNLTSVVAGWIAKHRSVLIFVMRENYEGQVGVTNKFKKLGIKRVNAFMQNKSNWLIHVTPQQINNTAERNKHKVIYIPNYSSVDRYTDIEKTISKQLRINYIGSVRDYKSLKMLMDSCRELDGIEIGIHGLGEEYLKLKKLENEYKNVHLTGYYDYKSETAKLYQNTDIIFCVYNIEIPNWKESRPIKFYESMLTLTPVISCYEMSLSELILEYDVGFLFHYNKEDELKNLLNNLIKNPDEIKAKKENIKKIKNKFTWESAVKGLDIIYKDFE